MKEKTKLQTKLTALVVTLFAAAVLPTGQVKAALQSNPNSHYKTLYNPTTWITQIRQIETSGNAMGLSETLDTKSLTATSESNGIDVHMMKSTEYGAIAILSASGYGNPQTLQKSSIKTTTGNKTGIYFNGSTLEWVAGGYKESIFSGVDTRYYDAYTDSTSAKIGDALGSASSTNPGCAGWHSANHGEWYGGYYILRDNGGLFSFQFNYGNDLWAARGVAVVGTGL